MFLTKINKNNTFDSHQPTNIHACFVFSNGVSLETAGLDDCAYLFWGCCSLHWVSFDPFLILWLSCNGSMHGWQTWCQHRHKLTGTGYIKKKKQTFNTDFPVFMYIICKIVLFFVDKLLHDDAQIINHWVSRYRQGFLYFGHRFLASFTQMLRENGVMKNEDLYFCSYTTWGSVELLHGDKGKRNTNIFSFFFYIPVADCCKASSKHGTITQETRQEYRRQSNSKVWPITIKGSQ